MKILLLSLILTFSISVGFSQKVRLSGKIENSTGNVLTLSSFTNPFSAEISIKADGTFSYETNDIKFPFEGTLTNFNNASFFIFIAPGYDMQIKADAKSPLTLRSSTVYTGPGSKTNAYRKIYSDALRADTVEWSSKDANSYITHLKERNRMLEGLINRHFEKNPEPFSNYFRQSLLRDLKFDSLNELFEVYAAEHKLNWQQIQTLVIKLGIKSINKELNNDANLSGFSYSFFVTNYPNFQEMYNAFPADGEQKKKGYYSLYLASKMYTEKVYDFVFYKNMPSVLAATFITEDFDRLFEYSKKVSDPKIRESIRRDITSRQIEAKTLSPGTYAPIFKLPDTNGTMYNLSKMLGKVVYIDLWASWCGPCIEETPQLRKIAASYKGNENLEIISIAAFDAKNKKKRYGIIQRDNMSWLQLEDTDDTFAKSCQVREIPRFIIIDKLGKIVDANAPRPSDQTKLMEILDRELKK
jgi:thiol-disulfide isomerase/thioredoxin